MNGLLNASAFGTVLQAVDASDSYHQLIERYIHDFTRLVYTPHCKLPEEELRVFNHLLL